MARKANFDDLIQAIQQAFIRVNDMSEAQHLEKLETYFEPDGTPKVFKMQYPYFDEDGIPAYRMASIPQICLVPVTSIKLDEIEVDFKVRLYGEVKLSGSDTDEGYLGYIPDGRLSGKDRSGFADIKLRFTSQEPPEGLMRIRDQFLKLTV